MECHNCPVQKIIDAYLASDSLAAFSSPEHRLSAPAANIQSALSAICLKCAKTTDDNNPSNHGRTFVSLDAENIGHDGKAPSFDFLISKADPDYDMQECARSAASARAFLEKQSARPSADNPSPLCAEIPPDIEQTLRQQLANFSDLSVIDICLVAHLLAGGSFASFATMEWLASLPIDLRSGRPIPISRQAAHARFKTICKKIPALIAIGRKSVGKPASGERQSLKTTHAKGKTGKNSQPNYARFRNNQKMSEQPTRVRRVMQNPVLVGSSIKRAEAIASMTDNLARSAALAAQAVFDKYGNNSQNRLTAQSQTTTELSSQKANATGKKTTRKHRQKPHAKTSVEERQMMLF